MDRCDECGYVYDVEAAALPGRLESFGERYRAALLPHRDEVVRIRPRPDVWSALEYTCHVRDVLLVQRDRLYVGLVEDRPSFPPMYRDQRPALARYNEQEPPTVLMQLDVAARLMAQAFAVLDADQLDRRCLYTYPTPAEHTLLWLGQHCVHEGEHHLRDAQAVLASVGG